MERDNGAREPIGCNAAVRKAIGKQHGDTVTVQLIERLPK
jgi:hypothetical protein